MLQSNDDEETPTGSHDTSLGDEPTRRRLQGGRRNTQHLSSFLTEKRAATFCLERINVAG
jgi:hypothetical protein